MQHQAYAGSTAWGARWPRSHHVAKQVILPSSRPGCSPNLSNKITLHSATVETASAPAARAASDQPPCLDFTDVNRHNFKTVLPVMRTAIQEATFVAIDTEFTGLSPEGVYEEPLDGYEERYKRLLASADSFIICQFGLSAFKWHAAPAPSRGGYWEARTFNAYIFPRPDDKTGWDKRFLCQASSLSYLAEQGFDFNKMIHDGISFVPVQVRDAKVRSLREEADNTARSRQPVGTQEEELVEAARARVLSWLLGEEAELLLRMPRRRRLRTLLRLTLQEEFQLPSLGYDPFAIDFCGEGADEGGEPQAAAVVDLEGAEAEAADTALISADVARGSEGNEGSEMSGSDEEAGPELIRLRRLDHWRPGNLIASGQQLTPRQRIEIMVEQSGFSQVLDILRDASRPLVGHNAAFDLAYTLSQFSGALPRSWRAYKELLQRTFPGGVYDTKHIATQLAAAGGVPVGDSALGPLYRTLSDAQWLRANVPGAGLPVSLGGGLPEIRHAPGFAGYADASAADKAHEAGFDAYMTGVAFTRLLRIVAGKVALQTGGATAEEAGTAVASAVSASAPDSTAAVAAPSAAASGANSSGCIDSDAMLLQPLAPYRGRIHFSRSDLPYADMYGSDPLPSRPAVLYVAGFGTQTRAPFLLQRFASLGFPPVQVAMLNAPNGAALGALVQLARPDLVPRAMAAIRKKWSNWTVLTFSEYYQNQQQQKQQQQQWGAGTGAGRAAPRMIRTAAAAAEASGAEGGSAETKTQRKTDNGGRGGGDGSSSSANATATNEQQPSAPPQWQQQQKKYERQRLQAFSQMVAAVTNASAVGPLPSRSGASGEEGARSGSRDAADRGDGTEESQRAGEAPTSNRADVAAETQVPITREESPEGGGDAVTSTSGADAGAARRGGARPGEAEAALGSSACGSGGVFSAAEAEAKRAAEAEASKRAAERLRSLALAAQRLKGMLPREEPRAGPAAEGGGGLALQRPGRGRPSQ